MGEKIKKYLKGIKNQILYFEVSCQTGKKRKNNEKTVKKRTTREKTEKQITSLRMIPTMAYIATYPTALERNI